MKSKVFILVLVIGLLLVSACSATLVEERALAETALEERDLMAETSQDLENQVDADATADISIAAYDEDDLDEEDLDASFDVVDTNILLADDGITYEGNGVIVKENLISIASAGVYLLSGKLSDGQIMVDTQDAGPVRLILNGVDLGSSSSAPIYVRNAEKTILTLVEGTENVVTDGTSYELDENDEPNAAIFSNDDLTINGAGSLTVNAHYNNGIESDDDLKIISGTITVTSVNDGIKGKDSVTVKDGFITIIAGGDGLQSDNDVDEGEGNILVDGGNFIITAEQDGIQAAYVLNISGGEFTIKTGGGSQNTSITDQSQWGDRDRQTQADESDDSAKGLKAGALISISGGSFAIDTADDALHSDNAIQIEAGTFLLSSGDDGVHADSTLEINNGTIDVLTSYEGLESASIIINSGTIHVASSDDGINGSDGTAAAMGGGPGMGGFGGGTSSLVVNGGYVYVEAGGDGIDINGTIEMAGGMVLINGPTESMNAAFDYTGSFNISGGFFVAVGSLAMAQAPSQDSSQYALMYNFASVQSAGLFFHIESQSGEAIATFMPTKAYQSVVISSPELQRGETYLVYSGGTITGSAEDGLYLEGAYRAGTEVASVTISDVVTTAGAAGGGMMGGRGGMPGGQIGGFVGTQGDMPQPGGMEMDQAVQLAFGSLALEGTSNAITQAQAAEIIPLWESYQALLSDATTTEETLDEVLSQIEAVHTEDQLEAISALDIQDMMTWMLEKGVENFGFRDRRDPQSGNGNLTIIFDYLLDYLQEK